ncbi:MAG TPA: biotin/lipoyl-containing protein, partial [Candidatus Dormibacteraeota bacterium]|nr:biotin/lipoyl-containing protein [Candidatus Dormibacteraeota bacterium]
MATTRVTMPQLGESVHEGTIARWLVKPGERVVEFEPMLEVDTDKVNAEVPAPVTGVLKEILASEGETVTAGTEIAVVELEAGAEAPAQVELRPEEAVPVGPDAGAARAGAAGPEAPPAVAPAAPAPPATPAAAAPAPARAQGEPGGEHRYSPGVMLLAQEQGVDLAAVTGTGLGGRVTKRDVRLAVEAREAATRPAPPARPPVRPAAPAVPAPPTPRPAPQAQPTVRAELGAQDEVVPLTRMRKLIAENMTRSKTTIPHAWQTQEVDMSGVVANRNAVKAQFQQREGFSLTYLPYVIAAAVASLREHPEV